MSGNGKTEQQCETKTLGSQLIWRVSVSLGIRGDSIPRYKTRPFLSSAFFSPIATCITARYLMVFAQECIFIKCIQGEEHSGKLTGPFNLI